MSSMAHKCYLIGDGGDPEIRRFTLESDVIGNFTYLKEKIRSIYPQLLRAEFTLTYTDEEGDQVTISSDDELVAALMCIKHKEGDLFRLTIKQNHGARATPAPPGGNTQGDLHIGVTCDGCQGAVRGYRYKCMVCPDYDLCGKCESGGVHGGHTFIRVNGPLPACFSAMRTLIMGGGGETPHWRRKHYGRFHHPQFNGQWNAWCPSGVNVDSKPAKGACGAGDKKPEEKGGSSCPFKSNFEQQAKEVAQTIQTNGPELLANIGATIASILGQFGIDTQVDVHPPNAAGGCPREAAKQQSEKKEQAKVEEEEPAKERIIPVEVEKDAAPVAKQDSLPEPIQPVKPSPYSEVASAISAARAAEAAAQMQQMGLGDRGSPGHSDDWTLVENPLKQAAEAASAATAAVAAAAATVAAAAFAAPAENSGVELGARPKSPQKPAEEEITAPLHPDALIAGALETMLAMGFTNEGGWLAQLLEIKGGDIGKALDVLNFHKRE